MSKPDASKQNQALYSAAQVRELDRRAIEVCGIPGIVLMKRAGRAGFEALLQRWPEPEQITVFCGAGNNGGDGYIIAGLAQQRGIQTRVVQLTPGQELQGDARAAWQFASDCAVPMLAFSEISFSETSTRNDAVDWLTSGVIVDALLGTGLSRPVTDDYRLAIECMNDSGLPVLAVDVPSGLHSDTGAELGVAVAAAVTVSFIGRKVGLTTGRGPALVGEQVFNDLDVPAEVYVDDSSDAVAIAETLKLEHLLSKVPRRARDAHKGEFGHVLVVGGDTGFGGAVLMAAEAAARVGAGLVSVATRPEHVAAVLARCPELMVRGVPSGQELEPLLEAPSVIVIGPGLGRSPWSEQMLQQVLLAKKPMVIDADALNLLSEGHIAPLDTALNTPPDAERWTALPHVLTPHPGEAARLLNVTNLNIQQDRLEACRQLQQKYGGTVLLKGAGTVIANADQNLALKICPYGNPGMATGGMGDVLSGVIGGLMAQGFDSDFAAELGACLHSKAADKAAAQTGERGLLASDLLGYIRALLNERA
ncbi:MAG: NAD(P)H-hydrate dehydratase [Porticoccaceae bacterium]|nr:NAD(P)H-hydrate dehydratase [Porticoccaceae bacterium]